MRICKNCKTKIISRWATKCPECHKNVNLAGKEVLIVLAIVIAIFVVPYLTIPALVIWWFYKTSKISKKAKIITTSTVGGLFAILLVWFGVAYASDAQPSLTVTEPSSLTTAVQAPQITIKGTYSPADRTVEVNGQTITAKNGNFQTVYQLKDGENKIEVQAGNLKWAYVYLDVTRQLTAAEKAAQITPTSVPQVAKATAKKSTKQSNPNTDNIAPKVLGNCSTASTGNYTVTNCVNIQLPSTSYSSRMAYVVIDPANDSPKSIVQTVANQAGKLCGTITDCVVDIFDNTLAANEQSNEDLLSQAAVNKYIKDPKNSDGVNLTTDHLIADVSDGTFNYYFIPTPTPIPTATPIPTDANGFPENYQNVTVADISKSPSDYNGKTIVFTCSVDTFPKDSSGNASAINCSDPNDYSSILQIDASAYDLTKINASDTIVVYGSGEGSFTGKNAFGGDVTESLVLGLYVNDLTSGYSNSK